MKQVPVKAGRRVPRKAESTLPAVAEPVAEPVAGDAPFLSFRYSCTEITATGRTARLTAKHARYEDGRLTSENFEGEVDRDVYERAVHDAQQRLFDQWRLFLRSFSLLT
jgi:hypothetical protein